MQISRHLPLVSLAIAVTAALGFAAPNAQAQINIGINIGTPPPPARYEVRPVYPGPGYAWEDGFWQPYAGRYQWHPGVWVREPYPDAYYVRPYYDHEERGYRMHPGHWEHRGQGHEDKGWHKGKFKDHDEGDGERGEYHHDNGKHRGHDKD